jgi:hypothetical protein
MKISITLLLHVFILNCFATNQIEDILYYNNDTLHFYESPLEQIPELALKLQAGEETFYLSSNCWRGFVATWQILDNQLYLLNVSECISGKNLNPKIEKILNRNFTDGKMLADWVKDAFWAGMDIELEQTLYISVFKHEYYLTFNQGVLLITEDYHFKKCYFDNVEKRTEYLMNQLDWKNLPEVGDKDLRFTVLIEINSEGKITKVSIEHSDDIRYNSEIINVLKELPCLTLYYYKGEIWGELERINLTINQENIKKYVH